MNHCLQCSKPLSPKKEDGFDRWVCESCGWTYYNNPRPCVTAVIGQEGKVLLASRAMEPAKGKWDLPGGFIEPGEHPECALAREICEELQCGLKSTDLLGFYPDMYGLEEIPILNIAFCCQTEGKIVPCKKEFSEIRWFGLDELPSKFAFASVRAILDDCIEKFELLMGNPPTL
ncbi:NUDIX domain-containing protein [candidate division KSB1 bacterium]|nr:NUDIX domain-containing protein [candidate division KSB1 bacterium]